MDIFADLVAEQDRLEAILDSLDDETWNAPSGALGWTVADVVLHLAQTDEAGRGERRCCGSREPGRPMPHRGGRRRRTRMVREQRADPAVVFAGAGVAAQRRSPDPPASPTPCRWGAAPLKPATLATTRVWPSTGPTGSTSPDRSASDFPDTDRLRHIAWLGHSTLPYAFASADEPHPVYCELTGPDGADLAFGPADAESPSPAGRRASAGGGPIA